MDLRQLRYVIALAEEQSFTRAAARLHITQPPLTKQIKAVEAELGFQLFQRTKRVVRITPAGSLFVERARRLLRDAGELLHFREVVENGEAGRLAIGYISALALDFLPRVVREFRADRPGIEIDLLEHNNPTLMDALRSRKLDVAFVRSYFQDADIATREILKDPFVVALPAGHRLAGRMQISIRELANDTFVTVNRSPIPSIYAHAMAICEKAGFHPRVVQESANLYSAVGLVSAGMGVAILPRSITHLGLEGVSYSALGDVKDNTRIVIAWRKDNQNPVVGSFVKEAAEIARRNGRRSAGPSSR